MGTTIMTWIIRCDAPEDMFNAWEDISDKTKEDLEKSGSIHCGGSGDRGEWCEGCRFAEIERDYEDK